MKNENERHENWNHTVRRPEIMTNCENEILEEVKIDENCIVEENSYHLTMEVDQEEILNLKSEKFEKLENLTRDLDLDKQIVVEEKLKIETIELKKCNTTERIKKRKGKKIARQFEIKRKTIEESTEDLQDASDGNALLKKLNLFLLIMFEKTINDILKNRQHQQLHCKLEI